MDEPLVVVALGGNALMRRRQPLDPVTQLENVYRAADELASLASRFRLVVAHGNGPQVGLLAVQNEACSDLEAQGRPFPLDVLGAESEGMIGYLLEQEIANRLPAGRSVATLLTRVEVDREDQAFMHPSKPIGPVCPRERMEELARNWGWSLVADGEGFRRAVPSPAPRRIMELRSIQALIEHGTVVICAGGGGIPVARSAIAGQYSGVEAVIDKDLAASLLARQLGADMLLIATDVPAVYADFGLPAQRPLHSITPEQLAGFVFPAGSIGPKVQAACEFVRATGHPAVIGALEQLGAMADGKAGTRVSEEGPSSDTQAQQMPASGSHMAW